jgi:hypothetical protein
MNNTTLPPEAVFQQVRPKDPPLVGALRREPVGRKPIGREEIAKAAETLIKYQNGKAALESRVVEDELWWELRHWEAIRDKKSTVVAPEPSSAWLFNAIANKHADAMDNYPEPVVLPREASDEESAKTLTSILPVILEQNNFEQTYSDNWWEKLKHGTAAYFPHWDAKAQNGLGEIAIKELDLLKVFWEPGITDIQKSRNLFIVELIDTDLLEQEYPQHKGHLKGNTITVKEYQYDDSIDNSDKSLVVDWYYKKRTPTGRTILHYVKFVGETLLYASENDPELADRGWYDHGEYPVVFDTLFPEKGTPVGFGYVSICKDPQTYIDKLYGNILEYSMRASKPRWFVSETTAINENEFLDWNKPFVHVAGELDDRRLQALTMAPLSSIYVEVAQLKVEEMKDTASNRDVNSGGTGSGVTAAAAIAALQEAGNKASRDMIGASYRTYVRITSQCTELARQFYDETRSFRITAPNGSYEFVSFNNEGIRDQIMGMGSDGQPLIRKPIFDYKIKAQKKNPFSRMEQNERAKELYAAGFFNPERAQEAMGALEMMDFEGIDKVKERVQQGATLLNLVQNMAQQMDQMAAIIQGITGRDMGIVQPQGGAHSAPANVPMGKGLDAKVADAQAPMTAYGDRLAKRSSPDMNMGAS